MNLLKHWAWTLLMAAGLLLFWLWLQSPTAGAPILSRWENMELVTLVLAVFCILLAATVWVIYKAIDQNRK